MAILQSSLDFCNPQVPLTRPPRAHVYHGGVYRRELPSIDTQVGLRREAPLPSTPSTTSSSVDGGDKAISIEQNTEAIFVYPPVSASVDPPVSTSTGTGLIVPADPPPKFHMTPSIPFIQRGLEANVRDVPVVECASDETKSLYAHFKAVAEPGFILSGRRRTTLRLVWASDHSDAGLPTGVMLQAWSVRAVEPAWVQFRLYDPSLPKAVVYLDFPIEQVKLPKRWRIYRWLMLRHLLDSHEYLHLGKVPAEEDHEYVISHFTLPCALIPPVGRHPSAIEPGFPTCKAVGSIRRVPHSGVLLRGHSYRSNSRTSSPYTRSRSFHPTISSTVHVLS